MIFIFDVDGTLTPSRGKIDPHFDKWFTKWVKLQHKQFNSVWLISGSDYPKTVEQMGQELVDLVDRCYNCMGNTVYINGDTNVINQFVLTYELRDYLKTQLEISPYPHRYGAHIEQRPGMINFSVVGRGAEGEQRKHYHEWDKANQERAHIAQDINTVFKKERIVAYVGGETGLDITHQGWDKGQILPEIHSPAVFFGDKMAPGENDYPLCTALARDSSHFKHKSIPVNGWIDTMKHLQNYM